MGLAEYRRKRSFSKTREPAPSAAVPAEGRPRFVVQLHHARRRHYDLRLQVGGVLKSWAVPKGPSFDPSVKRMAVEVEDHPVEYADFEGEIPAGQYGAGHVAKFDQGTWATESDPATQLAAGDLKFELFGEKLRGRWHLVRTGRPAKQPEWLLFKDRDDYAGQTESDDLVEHGPAKAPRRRRPRWSARAAKLTRAEPARGPVRPFPPQLARSFARPPEGPTWLHEIKWDGYRLLATIEQGEVRLWSRNHLEWTEKVPEIREALERLGLDSAALDGELIAGGGTREDFTLLEAVLSGERQGTLAYALFDVLRVDGIDVSRAPLRERKELLRALLEGAPPRLAFSAHVEGEGARAFAVSMEHGFEGVVSKRADRPHHPGRDDEWRKIKRLQSEEYAVVGTTPSKSRARPLGALLLAAPDPEHGLRYVGRVGTGFRDADLEELSRELGGLGASAPSVYVPRPHSTDLRGARWFPPHLVVEVFDRGRSRSGLLRQPSLKAIRRDKRVEDLEMTTTDETKLAISSPDKVLFPSAGITKREVAEYYEAVMDYVLPEIAGRPLSVVRCPSGIGEGCFFQKHRTAGMERVGAARIEDERGEARELLVVRDRAELMELVQFNAIELHPWGSHASAPEQADRIVFDLDPGRGVEWREIVRAAREARDRLAEVGLTSFVRTTGGKGLHVVVPLCPPSPFELVKSFARAFAEGLVRLAPERYVATAASRAREGKVYVDYLRNARGATAVASFSLRAREGAPVAMPLRWSELGRVAGGDAYDLRRARARVARLRSHPWEGFERLEQGLVEVASRLSDQLSGER